MRNKTFNLAITTTLAAAITACGPQANTDWDDGYTHYADRDTAVCVDQRTHKRIDDRHCSRGGGGGSAGWYYLGRNSAVPYHGETARGGNYTRTHSRPVYHAPAATRVTKSAAISRGGFGSSARSSGSSSFGG